MIRKPTTTLMKTNIEIIGWMQFREKQTKTSKRSWRTFLYGVRISIFVWVNFRLWGASWIVFFFSFLFLQLLLDCWLVLSDFGRNNPLTRQRFKILPLQPFSSPTLQPCKPSTLHTPDPPTLHPQPLNASALPPLSPSTLHLSTFQPLKFQPHRPFSPTTL